MTVTSTAMRAIYAGDGSRGPFPVPFRFMAGSDIQVIRTSAEGVPTELRLGTDYAVTGIDVETGGAVTTAAGVAAGQTVTILPNIAIEQKAIYVPNDPFPAKVHERALDRLTLIAQMLFERLSRSIRFPASEGEIAVLPRAVDRVGKVLGFDMLGRPTMFLPSQFTKGDPGGTDYAPGTLAQLSSMTIRNGVDQVIATGAVTRGDGGAGMPMVYDPAVNLAFVAANPRTSFRDQAGRGFRLAGKKSKYFEFGDLHACDYGVVGDGVTDDTAAVQAFFDTCHAYRKTAQFGSMHVKLSGPVEAQDIGIVFDQWGYGPGSPGFYVTGDGYTALTVLGAVADLCVSIYGSGEFEVDDTGKVKSDTRPKCNGVAFGRIGAGPLLASVVRSVRVYKLAGCGVSTFAWDATFMAISVEQCGTEDRYAWEVPGDAVNTCNECNFVRVQIELSCIKANFVSPFTLSCTFGKVHTERTYGRPNDYSWQFGPGIWQAVRASAINGMGKILVLAQSAEFQAFRPEGVRVEVSSNGGVVDFRSCEGGIYRPAAGSNGRVNFHGGNVDKLENVPNDWHGFGTKISLVTAGPAPAGTVSRLNDCTVGTLAPADAFSFMETEGGKVGELYGAGWGSLQMAGGGRVVLALGGQTFAYSKLAIGELTTVVGNITVDNVGAIINGTVEGNYTIVGASQTIWGESAVVTGQAPSGPPAASTYLGSIEGRFSMNMRPVPSGAAGAQVIVNGWRCIAGAWVSVRASTGT